MEARKVRQRFLGQTTGQPGSPQVLREGLTGALAFGSRWHAAMLDLLTIIGLQTISSILGMDST